MGFKKVLFLGLLFSMSISSFVKARTVQVDEKRLVDVEKVIYDDKSDSLLINISYIGGCDKHTFDFEKEIIDSKVRVRIYETNYFQDSCKANVKVNLGIPLALISLDLPTYIIQVQGAGDKKFTAKIASTASDL